MVYYKHKKSETKKESKEWKRVEIWPRNYPEEVLDKKITLNSLFLVKSKNDFFKHFEVSEYLMEFTRKWDFPQFARSFVFYYVLTKLNKQGLVLTSFNWKHIFNIALNPELDFSVLSFLEEQDILLFSEKQHVVDGALESFYFLKVRFINKKYSIVTDPFIRSLETMLRFLNVSEKECKLLIQSIYTEGNMEKVISFLENYDW